MLGQYLLASASLITLVFAQGTTRIAFTSVPATAEAGETYNITWGGGNGSPITLTLRKGDPNDLETVGIIADRVSETYYEWKVDEDLKSDDDYALQITQGQSDINYSGLFSIEGGSGSSSNTTTASSTTTGNSTLTSTSSGSRTTNGTMTSNSTESMTTTTESSTTETGTSSSTGTRRTSSSSAASTAIATSAPSSGSGALQLGSSAAFAMAVLGAVVFLN